MLLTPQLEPFFPNSCNLNIFSLKPETLCVWGGFNSSTWPSTYIYISHLINIKLLFFLKNNMFIIIKGNPNGYFSWAYVKKAYTYHKWYRRKKKLLIPFNMVNCFALISCSNNILLIHTTTTNENAALAICNC